MTGSKVRVRKQDPSVTAIGTRTAYIGSPVAHGPQDVEIKIMGMPLVQHDDNRDFLFEPQTQTKAFDAVHTFTVVHQVLTMYKRALFRTLGKANFSWQWGANAPLLVYPHAGIGKNAYYRRKKKALYFYSFKSEFLSGQPIIYICRSFDIVAHETGHAVLDGLQPGWWHTDSALPQTRALHESFADLTAILTMLAQMDQCEAIIAESKADLHDRSFFPLLGEQFGLAGFAREMGLRNADNDLKLSEARSSVYSQSLVFTGAIYDILAELFDAHKRMKLYDPAETLYRIGKHMTSLVVAAFAEGPKRNASFTDIAQRMVELEGQKGKEEWVPLIRKQFEIREIGLTASDRGADPHAIAGAEAPTDVETLGLGVCCGTLSYPEHIEEYRAHLVRTKS